MARILYEDKIFQNAFVLTFFLDYTLSLFVRCNVSISESLASGLVNLGLQTRYYLA